ncbi:MAG TPA: nucleotidyltransferase domain-containing protein [Gemmatimonadaceae bacterium]|nr:nucleotidyltransferase domain-containing protein [Gemmatimonadaceae bacterium]
MAKMTLDELVAQLIKVFGEGLHAVVLYGSAAAGEHIPKRSDYNVLVIVDAITTDTLQREAAVGRAWGEAGNPPPLTLTVGEWRSSPDIFPMEYADILERHRVLYGVLPTEGIRVDKEHLRLQAEYQAMGKLLQLRQGALRSGGGRRDLAELLAASLSTFMVIFRAVVRLHDAQPDADYAALCAQVADYTGVDTSPFVTVVRHIRGESKLSDDTVLTVLAGYLAGAERIVAHIDQLGAA